MGLSWTSWTLADFEGVVAIDLEVTHMIKSSQGLSAQILVILGLGQGELTEGSQILTLLSFQSWFRAPRLPFLVSPLKMA